MHVPAKVYENIMVGTLRAKFEKQIEDTQYRFRSPRGNQDALFTLKQLPEKNNSIWTRTILVIYRYI